MAPLESDAEQNLPLRCLSMARNSDMERTTFVPFAKEGELITLKHG